jgi:hypothetical protein
MRFFLNPISPLFNHDFACIYYALIILVIRYLHHQTVLSVTNFKSESRLNRIVFSFLIWAAQYCIGHCCFIIILQVILSSTLNLFHLQFWYTDSTYSYSNQF